MANVFDVAAYILRERGGMSTWKLQKLVYYSQAWSLVWDDEELFPEQIEAWINGPVCRALYDKHKGKFRIARMRQGNADALTENQKDTVDTVLEYYGERSPQWLSDLTHMEAPWRMARKGVPPGERGNSAISQESMAEFYSSLPPDPD